MTAYRKSVNSPDSFCYIYGSFTIPSQRTNISIFVKYLDLFYFGIALGDQYKSWAPHTVDQEKEKEDRIWYSNYMEITLKIVTSA